MKRHMTLLSAMLAGAAFAQTAATSTTIIGEVTLTRPTEVPAQGEDLVDAEPVDVTTTEAVETPTESLEEKATEASGAATAPEATQTTAEPISEPAQAEVQPAAQPTQSQVIDGVEVVPAQPLKPVEAPKPVNPPTAPAPAPAPAPVAAPVAKPAAAPASAQGQAQAKPTQAAPKPAATPAASAAATTAKPMTTATVSKAVATAAPSDLPSGWRHISGDILGDKSVTLPAGSTIQVAIEGVNKVTGRHTPHLVVSFDSTDLPADYYINYNPGRMNMAAYDYVIQAKVFDADGDMLYMADSRQPLPSDLAAKLQIDMSF